MNHSCRIACLRLPAVVSFLNTLSWNSFRNPMNRHFPTQLGHTYEQARSKVAQTKRTTHPENSWYLVPAVLINVLLDIVFTTIFAPFSNAHRAHMNTPPLYAFPGNGFRNKQQPTSEASEKTTTSKRFLCLRSLLSEELPSSRLCAADPVLNARHVYSRRHFVWFCSSRWSGCQGTR